MTEFIAVVQAAIERTEYAVSQRVIVCQLLSALGHFQVPGIRPVEMEGVKNVSLFTWPGSPAGDLCLVGGHLLLAEDLEEFLPGSGYRPARRETRDVSGAD